MSPLSLSPALSHARFFYLLYILSAHQGTFSSQAKLPPALLSSETMASTAQFFVTLSVLALLACSSYAQLSPNFYATSCPNVQVIVRNAMRQAVNRELRIDSSPILPRLLCKCGCDASILLDDTPTFTGEKNALPNQNSARGIGLIHTLKTNVEAACNATVSCADILALAARDGVVLLGGPSWAVPLGRRDTRTASQSAANSQISSPFASLSTLISMFAAKGLNVRDMTTLSGGHTIGQARCSTFRNHPNFAARLRNSCPATGGDNNY
ncbi:hypothetical protein HHK36_005145 [Tetracentron sinense]|uniref:Plant heme peroxidase family profile domain-containing protein n=1 Tax=Tetracentron sinense TaxID=13715 RepID=A0A834ZPU3_TETSI|nr:hypothetical protein HHK36_005145 [Tetracentron sinense]